MRLAFNATLITLLVDFNSTLNFEQKEESYAICNFLHECGQLLNFFSNKPRMFQGILIVILILNNKKQRVAIFKFICNFLRECDY